MIALYLLSIFTGLALLVWSADRFVEGSIAAAKQLKVPPLLIGMIIVGFGTSAPEMIVSAISAFQGSPGIALGNAYGSNICNIALILGVTAIINPIQVHSAILKKELPILSLVTFISVILLINGSLSRADAVILLILFLIFLVWSTVMQNSHTSDSLAREVNTEINTPAMTLKKSIFMLFLGLAVLILSSRLLVFGAVETARLAGVSDLLIGLTIVALGTSLPELASSVMAARKKQHDIALGNIIGSNLFNTLAVVGIAGVIHPLAVEREILTRDVPVMVFLTLSLFLIGYGFKHMPGQINRFEGLFLLLSYAGYTGWLVLSKSGLF